MPIKPENLHRYPDNWNEISEDIRFNRAKNKCEVCGLQNYSIGHRNDKGIFIGIYGNIYLDGLGHGFNYYSNDKLTYEHAAFSLKTLNDEMNHDIKYMMIILTTAHLDHMPENCDYDNLKAMCQKCHNSYDAEHRKETRAKTKQQKLKESGQLSLF